MPKFSIKDLLIATAIVATGTALISSIFRFPTVFLEPSPGAAFVFCWYVGGMLIGAGLFWPFRRPWMGIALGFIVQITLVVGPRFI